MSGWVQDDEHSWHLPCHTDTINARVTSDIDDGKYRFILEIKPYRGIEKVHQVGYADDKDDLMTDMEGWMLGHTDPTEVMQYAGLE